MLSPRQGRVFWAAVLSVLALVFLWSRLPGLDQSFWHDEVVTVMRFASQGPHAIFFGDYIPNNHVLFELLAWGTTSLLGESEFTYRLWSLVPSIGAAAWLTWWATRRFGYLVGVATLTLVTLSPLLLQVSREARGYGLAMLAMVGMITQADSAIRSPDGGAVWRYIAFGTLGVLTLPVFVLPFAFGAGSLLLVPKLRRRTVIGMAAAGAACLAWFSPVLDQIVEHSSQQFGTEVLWHGFASLSLRQLLFPVFRLFGPGTPDIMLGNPQDPTWLVICWYALSAILLITAITSMWNRGKRVFLVFLLLPVVGTYIVMAALDMWAADRFVSFLSLPLFVLISIGLDRLADGLRRMPAVGIALASVLATWAIVSFYPVADDVIQTPHEAMKDAAGLADQSGAATVLTNSVRPEGLRYYLVTPLEVASAQDLERIFCSDTSGYVFVEHNFKVEEQVDLSCLTASNESPVRLRQRARGRMIDVWFVGVPEVYP